MPPEAFMPFAHNHVVPNGVYFIQKRYENNYCIQLDANGTITAAEMDRNSARQQWRIDNAYELEPYMPSGMHTITNLGTPKLRLAFQNGAVSTTGDTRWVILPTVQSAYIIFDAFHTTVLDVDSSNKVSTQPVSNARSVNQFWYLHLVSGSAPQISLFPGQSYVIKNVSTSNHLFASAASDGSWDLCTGSQHPKGSDVCLISFDAREQAYIVFRGSPHASPYYVVRGAAGVALLTHNPASCGRLIPVTGKNDTFYINGANTDKVLTDTKLSTHTQPVFKPLLENDDSQHWKILPYST